MVSGHRPSPPEGPPSVSFLSIRGLGKSFGGVPALADVGLELRAGEVHGLVGENGAGKSTLIKILAGAERPDAGEIVLDGRPVAPAGPHAAEALGFRFIHQELNLVPQFDAVENVFLGRRYPRRGLRPDWRRMRAEVAAIAGDLAPGLPLDRPVGRLSPGQQQMAEILRAFLSRARLVVMDEPTAALSEAEAARLTAAIRRLRAQGTAVVYVSHRLEEVLAVADRVTVLRDGRVVATATAAGLTTADLIRLMSGAAPAAAAARPRVAAVAPLLRLETASGGALAVAPGEIVGLYGLLGAGRSRLLRAVYGAAPAPDLRMTWRGRPYRPRSPAAAIRQGIAYVPEDRRAQGLVLAMSVRANATLPLLRFFRRRGGLPLPSRTAETGFVARLARELGLRLAGPEQPVGRLSGGNQQKVLVGRWFARDNLLFLLDEPTRGIDVASKAALHDQIRRLAAGGAAVLFASSDLREALDLADRLVVLRGGAVAASFEGRAARPEDVLRACYGG